MRNLILAATAALALSVTGAPVPQPRRLCGTWVVE
jgi:hypothetical protein